MIDRRIKEQVLEALDRQAAVALIGPRQVGKTTLVLELAAERNALYLDLVLLISLLIWRLMERSMRQYVKANDCTLPGWVRRKTKKPTAFMMTTKFASVMVITMGHHRQPARPLKVFQLEYLKALGVTVDVFTVP